MAFKADKIWFDGKFVNWDDAKIHVLSHVIHYGTGAFEGLRLYRLGSKSAIFRLESHTKRLLETCKIYRIDVKYTAEEINEAIIETVRVNKLTQAYIRPLIFRGFGELGVNPFKCPVQMIIAAWDWGKYLGADAIEKGVSVCISSWNRAAQNTFPSLAKACGNYLNSQLIKIEALQNGYDEGIALDVNGYVAEGSGENIFMVRNGSVYTPPSSASNLPGITRHTIFNIAQELGINVKQHLIPREALYIADEIFMTGTAAEITPVTAVDKITVNTGKRGPITEKIQNYFFSLISGEIKDKFGFLHYI